MIAPEHHAKLTAIGPYETEIEDDFAQVTWSDLPELNCDWTQFRLVFFVFLEESNRRRVSLDDAYQALIDAWNRVKQRFSQLEPRLRKEVLTKFEHVYAARMSSAELANYQDQDDRIVDDLVLNNVDYGNVHLEYADGVVRDVHFWFAVGWDEEHGLPVEHLA